MSYIYNIMRQQWSLCCLKMPFRVVVFPIVATTLPCSHLSTVGGSSPDTVGGWLWCIQARHNGDCAQLGLQGSCSGTATV